MEWLVAAVVLLAVALGAAARIAVVQRRRATELGVENARWRTLAQDRADRVAVVSHEIRTVIDGVGRVDVLGSQRELPAAAGAESASSHVVLVRPESVQVRHARDAAEIEAAPGESVSGSHGRILRTVFYGSVVEYEIDTDAGTIIAEVADPDPNGILAEGELVEVDFPRSRGWLLPA